MFNRPIFSHKDRSKLRNQKPSGANLALAIVLAVLTCLPLAAQDQSGQTPSSQTPAQTPATQAPDNGKPKQDVPDEAGGPTDNVGPYAIPKKKTKTLHRPRHPSLRKRSRISPTIR